MSRSLWVVSSLFLGSLSLLAGPPTVPSGAEVKVESDSFVLLDLPSDPGPARLHIHAALEKGCMDLVYLNQQLTTFYQAQEADLLLARKDPEVFRKPLSCQEEALCKKLTDALKDPGPVALENGYRKAFLDMAQWFAEALTKGSVSGPMYAPGHTPFMYGGELYAPAIAKIVKTMARIDGLSGPDRPILDPSAIRGLTGTDLEADLAAINEKWGKTGTNFKPCLDALVPIWKPYREALSGLALVATDVPWDKEADQVPLRMRLMKRALMIHAFERHRAALAMNLQVWLLCAASYRSGREKYKIGNEKNLEFDMTSSAMAAPRKLIVK